MTTASRRFLVLVFAGTFAAAGLRGGTERSKTVATATEEQPEEYKNWIELGYRGSDHERRSRAVRTGTPATRRSGLRRHPGSALRRNFRQKRLFSVDGHALWDINDYDITVQLAKPNLGYIKAGYTEFRSWYDGNAGFFPHNDVFFDPPYPEMHIDRGDAWIELGLRAPDWPEITIRYDHEFRFGQKDSTVWGDTNLTGLQPPFNSTRKIVPSFRNIDEKRDIFSFEASKTIGNTDVLLGMRYEHNTNDYSLNMERGAGQLPPAVPPPGQQRKVTQTTE